MKKILGIAALAAFFTTMLWVFSYAAPGAWISSNTASADTTKNLCVGRNYLVETTTVTQGNRGIIHGACVNTGVNGTNLVVYNSSGSANNALFTLNTSTQMPCSLYDIAVSSGLTYSTSGTANVTLTYQCY